MNRHQQNFLQTLTIYGVHYYCANFICVAHSINKLEVGKISSSSHPFSPAQ